MDKGIRAFRDFKDYVFSKILVPSKQHYNIKEVEKSLEALEIIKTKCSPLLKQYLLDLLPKEEYDLLKEILKDD